jgi:hypothetical protein
MKAAKVSRKIWLGFFINIWWFDRLLREQKDCGFKNLLVIKKRAKRPFTFSIYGQD